MPDPSTDVGGWNLREAGKKDPEADDLASVDAKAVSQPDHREDSGAEHNDGGGASIMYPRLELPESVRHCSAKQDDLAQPHAKGEVQKILAHPDVVRAPGFRIEGHGISGDVTEP